jgi:hypothetical protein
VLWYFLLAEDYSSWEQRIGSFCRPCQHCRQEAWQIAFRMYRTKGSPLSPASSAGFAEYECCQIRCSGCGYATMVAHPHYWVSSLGVPFNQEACPAGPAVPGYASIAFFRR